MQAWHAEPLATHAPHERRVIEWSSSGLLHADESQFRQRRHKVTFVLQQIADALGDVDGYIGQIDERARQMPAVAAAIARRLLEAGRTHDAWVALDAVEETLRAQAPIEWDQARVDVLEALGRLDDAQDFRWQRFLATLSAVHLRAHLRKLPDFDDLEAEQQAFVHALAFKDLHQALGFLITWPELQQASELVLSRSPALDGNLYELLSPAADALDDRFPLAATLLRRAMINFTLRVARSTRYKHAARQLQDCRTAAARIADFLNTTSHAEFEKALRASHSRKAGFWQEVERLK